MKIKNIILLTAFLFVNSYLGPKERKQIPPNGSNNGLTVKKDDDYLSQMNDFLSEIKTKVNYGKNFLLENKVKVAVGAGVLLAATDIVIAVRRKKIAFRHICNYSGVGFLAKSILEPFTDNSVESKNKNFVKSKE